MEKAEKLKVSQYNYYIPDEEGNLILCNFAKGYESFSKIAKNDIDKFYAIINNPDLKYDENCQYIVDLFDRGLLVPELRDELLVAQSMYYNSAMDNRLMIIVMPTEQCNFRCTYCYESYEKGEMSKTDQIALLKFIQKKLCTTSKVLLSWFGGEPLEAYEVVKYITESVNKMCEKNKVLFSADMTTNAYNLNPEIFDCLYNLKVFRYQITLDGLQEQHDKQRIMANGEGTFNKIVSNLLYIKNSPQYKFAEVTIRVNVTKPVLDNLDKFISFYKETFGDDTRFGIAFTPVNDMGGESVKSLSDELISQTELYTKFNESGIYKDAKLNLPTILRAFSPTEGLCYASKKNTFVIGSDLTIYKCTVHFEMRENVIGKITSIGEAVINEDRHCKWFMNQEIKERCKSCFLFPTCYGGGCPHKRVFVNGSRETCVLNTWKKEIKNAITYLIGKYNFKVINFSEVSNEN